MNRERVFLGGGCEKPVSLFHQFHIVHFSVPNSIINHHHHSYTQIAPSDDSPHTILELK